MTPVLVLLYSIILIIKSFTKCPLVVWLVFSISYVYRKETPKSQQYFTHTHIKESILEMAVLNRATHTPMLDRQEGFHLLRPLWWRASRACTIHRVKYPTWVSGLSRRWVTGLHGCTWSWPQPKVTGWLKQASVYKVLIKDSNSIKGEDKEWDDKKYLVLIRQYKIDPLSKTI